jgi:hypothetical protein
VEDFYWCLLACTSVIAVNVVRLSLMGMSARHYALFHSPAADLVIGILLLTIMIGIALLGVRRELFDRV